MPEKRNVSEIVYVENLDSSDLMNLSQHQHPLHKAENSDDDMDEMDYVNTPEGVVNPQVNELQVLHNAAFILKQ
jgi:hypothetical protein